MTKKVGIVIGSLRKEAFSRKLATRCRRFTLSVGTDKVGT